MKKSSKMLLSILCLCPILLLTACVPPPSYLITAKSSDIELGIVLGYKEKEMEEGSTVTLTAQERNPFICWIKDDSVVVGTETALKLTYNAETAGEYTAVFEENNINSMMYATLASVNLQPHEQSSVNYDIKTALVASGSDNFRDFASGSLNDSEPTQTDKTSILRVSGTGLEYQYKILVSLTYTSALNIVQTTEFQLTNLLDNSLFNDDGVCVVTEYNETINASITLTFEKLTYSMYHGTAQN